MQWAAAAKGGNAAAARRGESQQSKRAAGHSQDYRVEVAGVASAVAELTIK